MYAQPRAGLQAGPATQDVATSTTGPSWIRIYVVVGGIASPTVYMYRRNCGSHDSESCRTAMHRMHRMHRLHGGAFVHPWVPGEVHPKHEVDDFGHRAGSHGMHPSQIRGRLCPQPVSVAARNSFCSHLHVFAPCCRVRRPRVPPWARSGLAGKITTFVCTHRRARALQRFTRPASAPWRSTNLSRRSSASS